MKKLITLTSLLLVTLSLKSQCINPFNIGTTSITSTSIDVDWGQSGSENRWLFYYSPSATSGFYYYTTYSSNTSLTGLQPNSRVVMYVRSICGVGDSSALIGPFVVNTPCTSNTNLPYVQKFDTDTFNILPCGWARENVNNDQIEWLSLYVGATYSGKYTSGIQSLDVSDTRDDWIYTPSFQLDPSKIYEVEFYANTWMGDQDIEVYFGGNQNSFSMTDLILDTTINSVAFARVHRTFSPQVAGDYHLGIHSGTSGEGGIYFDNFKLTEVPNTTPSIANIPNQYACGGGVIKHSFNATDNETPNNLTVSATSSNTGIISNNNIVIEGDSIQLTPNFNQTGTVDITITVTDQQGASTITSYSYTIFPKPTVSINLISNQLEATLGFMSYQWGLGGVEIGGVNNSTYSPSQNGTYTVKVEDNNGCENIANFVYTFSSIKENNNQLALTVYPNPSNTNTIYVEAPESFTGQLQMIDINGKVSNHKMNHKKLDVSHLSRGVYIIRLNHDSGIYQTRFIKI